MSQKKAKIFIFVSLGITLAALIALVIVIISRNSRKKPEEFFYVPKGSVMVWRVTTIYRKVGDNPRYCYEKSTVDALGRYETETTLRADGDTEIVIQFLYDGETKHTTVECRNYKNGANTSYTIYYYDAEGRDLGCVFYDDEGSGLEKCLEETIDLDDEGNVLMEWTKLYLSDGTTEYREDYDAGSMSMICMNRKNDEPYRLYEIDEFDEQRRMVRKIRFDENGEEKPAEWTCEYREDGSRTETSYYEESGLMNVIEYDEENRTVKDTFYNSDGTESRRTEYEYTSDRNGSTETITYYVEGEIRRWTEREYNLQGDMVSFTNGGPAGTKTTFIDIRYDAEGRMLSQSYDRERSDGSAKPFYEEFEYDAYGNMTRHAVEKEDGTTEVWEYEYTPYILTEAQAAEAEEYYDAKQIDGP